MTYLRNFTLVFLTLLSFSSQALSAERESAYERVMRTGTIRCGFLPWPPFWDVDPQTGKATGLNREVFDNVFKLLDLKVEYVEVTLGFHVNELKEGKVDAICGDGPWIISAAKQLDYGRPYVFQPVYVYGRADKTIANLDDESVLFAGIDGDLSTDLKNFRFPKARIHSLQNLTDPAQLMMEIVTGKADAVITDAFSARRMVESNPGKLVRLMGGEPLAVYPNTVSVVKGESELLDTLNEGLTAALNLGLVDEALGHYDPDGNLLRVAPAYSPSTSRME